MSQMRRKEVVKSLLGRKRVLELDVLMTERREKKKKMYAAPPFGVF